MMTKTGMFVVTNPNKFVRLLPRIQKEIKKTLYVQFFPEKHLRLPQKQGAEINKYSPTLFSSILVNFYCHTVPFRHLDVRVLLGCVRNSKLTEIATKSPVEVVYFDQILNQDEMRTFLQNCVVNRTRNCEVVSLVDNEQVGLECGNIVLENGNVNQNLYDHVVLGGTFDRLHLGHKIMLSEAVLRSRKKITVGVTNTDMLKTKKLWELIEPCDIRMDKVREFLEDVEPHLEYDIVPIGDMYGPTKDDPTFEMIIVSAETVGGGSKVNDLRVKNGLKPLVVHSVGLLNDTKLYDVEEDKISSSNGRIRILGTRIHEPKVNPNLPPYPYIIGLTGGIAAGKSSISERLKELGAGVVNCDKVAHDLYKSGKSGYEVIVQHFGRGILAADGEIDRKILGSIVFKDKEKLKKLNSLLWPLILTRTKELLNELYKDSHRIVVMEAAVLIQAGWQDECHEIWTCIIPPEEAVIRLKERNLSEQEALSRIQSQPSNSDQVTNAHVVFCTLWHREFTRKQVDKAWIELNSVLDSV